MKVGEHKAGTALPEELICTLEGGHTFQAAWKRGLLLVFQRCVNRVIQELWLKNLLLRKLQAWS